VRWYSGGHCLYGQFPHTLRMPYLPCHCGAITCLLCWLRARACCCVFYLDRRIIIALILYPFAPLLFFKILRTR